MSKAYSKRTRKSSLCAARVVEKPDLLTGRVAVELPVSMAEVIGGVSAEIERLPGDSRRGRAGDHAVGDERRGRITRRPEGTSRSRPASHAVDRGKKEKVSDDYRTLPTSAKHKRLTSIQQRQRSSTVK